jgi:hypothetical protein
MMASSIDPAASKVTVTVTITETDEVDTPLATFLYSETPTACTTSEKGQRAVVNSRVDVLVSRICFTFSRLSCKNSSVRFFAENVYIIASATTGGAGDFCLQEDTSSVVVNSIGLDEISGQLCDRCLFARGLSAECQQ